VKIVVTNTVTLNGGDAAILQALLRLIDIAVPGAEVTVLDSQPEVAKRYYPSISYRALLYDTLPKRGRRMHMRRLMMAGRMLGAGIEAGKLFCRASELASMQVLRDADAIISTGGTYLVEHYDIGPRLFELGLYLALRKPVLLFTQSLGPFSIHRNRHALRDIFRRVKLLLLRDQRSRDNVLELGISESNVRVVADCVFALAEPSALEQAAQRRLPTNRPLRVALSVREWSYFDDLSAEEGMRKYVDGVTALVRHLLDEGAEITFVSTCQGIDEYWTHDDRVAARFVAELPLAYRSKVTVDRAFRTPAALATLLGTMDLVIATRMHMAILALSAGTPVMPLSYEFKTEELFRRLGAETWLTRLEEIDSSVLITRFRAFREAIDHERAQLFEAVDRERRDALRAADLLRVVLSSCGRGPEN
jgi:colanic acid/amylovoran biosynthesis protein